MQQKWILFLLTLFVLLNCDREKKSSELSKTTVILPPSPKLTPEEEAKKLLPRWIKGLQNRDPKIRQEMIQRILGANGWKEDSAKKALLLNLRLEEDGDVFIFLRDKIWELAPDTVLEIALERFRDPRVLFRFVSFKLLKGWQEPRWKNLLEKTANDSQEVEMPYAVLLLGHPEKNPQHLETLKNIASRNNYIEPPLAIDLLIPLVQTNPDIQSFLRHLLVEHISAPVRLYCLRTLTAVLPLEELLMALQDPEGNVRLEMIQQMISRPTEKTGGWLVEASQNIENRPDIRQKALEGLFQIQSSQAMEACQIMLVQRNPELHEVALKLLIEQDHQEICWLGEALLSSAYGETLLALKAPQLSEFPQLRVLLEPLQKAEDYDLRSRSDAILKQWDQRSIPIVPWDTPQNTFELFQRSMLHFCLTLAFSCLSSEYQRQNPSIDQTLNTLQNPVFRTQHKNLIQQLQLLDVSTTGETAIGKLNRGEIQFIRENGQWKINRIQLH